MFAFSNELKPFFALYKALNFLLNHSMRLLLVSLDIGATGMCLVLGNTLAIAWLYEGNLSVLNLLGSPNFLASLIKVKAESSLRDFVRWNANIKLVSESIASHK